MSEDGTFKQLLTHAEAQPIVQSFLRAFLNTDVKKVVIRSNEPVISSLGEKRVRHDVNCNIFEDDSEESQADVEMHAYKMYGDCKANDHHNIRSRLAYTLCQLFVSQHAKESCSNLKKSYQVNILSYVLDPDVESFFVDDIMFSSLKVQKRYDDKARMIIIELPKLVKVLAKPVSEMSDAEKWALFLAYADNPKHQKLITELAMSKEEARMKTREQHS